MIKEITSNVEVERNAPLNLKVEDKDKFTLSEELPLVISKPVELHKVMLVSNGIFFQNYQISKLSYPFHPDNFIHHYVNLKFLLKQWIRLLFSKTVEFSGNSIIITDLFSSNYYHWFMETLPRLHNFKDSLDKNATVISPYSCYNKEYIT